MDDYRALARSNPAKLRALIADDAAMPFWRGVALEAYAEVAITDDALPFLLKGLEDAEPSIREGAVHGLAFHLEAPTVRAWLEKLAATDPEEDVRQAALDVL